MVTGDHLVRCRNAESVYCTPETNITNIILYAAILEMLKKVAEKYTQYDSNYMKFI